MNAVPAGLDPDLDNHDVIHGIVLPNLRLEHDTLQSRKGEYTDAESRQIDMTGLVMEMNHNDDWLPVGRTIAYTVNPQPNGFNAAEAVFKLNREPDEHNPDDPLAVVTALQRNLLMTGYHKDLSLGHETAKWNANVDVDGVVKASADPYQPAVTYVKYHKEISTCNRGRRPGSHIKGYYPCARSLRRSDDEAIRSFAKIYGYEPPPRGAYRGSREYDAYLANLHAEVRQRRSDALRQSNFTPILRARGFHAASADATKSTTTTTDSDMPVMCTDDLYLTQVAAGIPTSANVSRKPTLRAKHRLIVG